ncbi:MAG: hypothetical protein IT443_01465 [Phycisphaeraceae bacterium]|nr:hypothetical protein [Phycisphaeraceae bacterium]
MDKSQGPSRALWLANLLLVVIVGIAVISRWDTARGEEKAPPPPKPRPADTSALDSPPPGPPMGDEELGGPRGGPGGGPGGGRGGRWGGGGEGRALTAEQIKEMLDVLREYDPNLADRIGKFSDQAPPEEVAGRLREHVPGLMRLAFLKRVNPERYELRLTDLKLERRSNELADQYREAAAADTARSAAVKDELAKVVADHFDVRQKLREDLLKEFEKRIEEMRAQITERQQSKDKLVVDRLKELIGQERNPTW